MMAEAARVGVVGPFVGVRNRRIFESTQDARLVAVDAATGAPCVDFGKAGQVSLGNVLQYDPAW